MLELEGAELIADSLIYSLVNDSDELSGTAKSEIALEWLLTKSLREFSFGH